MTDYTAGFLVGTGITGILSIISDLVDSRRRRMEDEKRRLERELELAMHRVRTKAAIDEAVHRALQAFWNTPLPLDPNANNQFYVGPNREGL